MGCLLWRAFSFWPRPSASPCLGCPLSCNNVCCCFISAGNYYCDSRDNLSPFLFLICCRRTRETGTYQCTPWKTRRQTNSRPCIPSSAAHAGRSGPRSGPSLPPGLRTTGSRFSGDCHFPKKTERANRSTAHLKLDFPKRVSPVIHSYFHRIGKLVLLVVTANLCSLYCPKLGCLLAAPSLSIRPLLELFITGRWARRGGGRGCWWGRGTGRESAGRGSGRLPICSGRRRGWGRGWSGFFAFEFADPANLF